MRKKKNSTGDCYQVAGKFALDRVDRINNQEFIGTPYVVHAEVSGRGALDGIRFGHAWIEDDYFIFDFSNGLSLIYPKVVYYSIGNVVQKEPKYYKYTFEQARDNMLEVSTFGPWDLVTESGL